MYATGNMSVAEETPSATSRARSLAFAQATAVRSL